MIACTHLRKTFHRGSEEIVALKDASFKVSDGEYVAIMGPSGSGKSTLMNLLGALDTPTSGTYLFDGIDVSSLSDDKRSDLRKNKIGFVFQSFNLLPRASAVRNVSLPLVYAGLSKAEREKRARKALISVGFDEARFAHHPNELSGGQMQRVAIARALVNEPRLILADEPTGNLDTKTGDIVLATFEELNRQGRTIVLITHEPDVAYRAKRVIHVRDGEIVKDEKTHV